MLTSTTRQGRLKFEGRRDRFGQFHKCRESIAAPDDLPPTNVSVAGESRIHVVWVDPDPNSPAGIWIWGVADNLRVAATNAVRIAEELLAKSQVA